MTWPPGLHTRSSSRAAAASSSRCSRMSSAQTTSKLPSANGNGAAAEADHAVACTGDPCDGNEPGERSSATARPWRDSVSAAPPVPQPTSRMRARAGSSRRRGQLLVEDVAAHAGTTSATPRPPSRMRETKRPSATNEQHRAIRRPAERQRRACSARQGGATSRPRTTAAGGVDDVGDRREVVILDVGETDRGEGGVHQRDEPPGSRRGSSRRAESTRATSASAGANSAALRCSRMENATTPSK